AKVHRDAMMTAWHDGVPHYNWASNKGYGAPEHLAAIRSHGPHAQHRNVFIRHVLQMDLFETVGTPVDPREAALVEADLAAAAWRGAGATSPNWGSRCPRSTATAASAPRWSRTSAPRRRGSRCAAWCCASSASTSAPSRSTATAASSSADASRRWSTTAARTS